MGWTKLGRIFAPDGSRPWARSHAAFPTADLRSPDVLRIYFTSLDADAFGRGGYVDVDPADPLRILAVAHAPVLDLGPAGDFDDAGANPFCVVELEGERHLYYNGWQRTARAPFQIFTGLAVERPDGRFERLARTPVLERTDAEPHIRSSPCVIRCRDGFAAWYMASSRWVQRDGVLHPTPSIRRATSTDGLVWISDREAALRPSPSEYGIGRPAVIYEDGRYRMWFSVRAFGQNYAIGYAESDDGVTWTRRDDRSGISPSHQGWDSEMVGHPNIVRAGGRLLMFYNGNGQGAAGFGCAEWID